MAKQLTARERMWRQWTEREVQDRIMEFARLRRWRVCHFHDSRRQVGNRLVGDKDAEGWPDLFMVRPPDMVAVECKKELGRTTAAQDAWLADLAACGVTVRVARPSNLEEVLALLR